MVLTLAYSYDALTSEQQVRFRQSGVLAYDQPFDLFLLAGLWDIAEPGEGDEEAEPTQETAREWASKLCLLSLMESATEMDGWYRQHPVLHSYASSRM